MSMFCTGCGSPLAGTPRFCPVCGRAAAGPAPAAGQAPAAAAASTACPARWPDVGVPSPLAVIRQALAAGGKQFLQALRRPKTYVKLLFLLVFWGVPVLLRAKGYASLPLQLFYMLSFAGGGVSAKAHEVVGGILGKAALAYFLFSLAEGRLRPALRGARLLLGSLKGRHARPAQALLGLGLALAIYNFLAGTATLSACMVGVSCSMLCLRALGGSSGFLRAFLASLARRRDTARPRADLAKLNSLLSGLASGFALAVPLSAPAIAYLPLMLGLVLLAAGGFLLLPRIGRQEVKAS